MGGKVLELEFERLKTEGRTEGEAIGQIQGENRLGSLITRLIQEQRTEEIPIVSVDSKRREQLYKEYNLEERYRTGGKGKCLSSCFFIYFFVILEIITAAKSNKKAVKSKMDFNIIQLTVVDTNY